MKEVIRKIPGARQLVKIVRKLRKGSEGRDFLLKALPGNSIGAEIGVHLGDFSGRIMKTVSPRELHLIDPWEHQESEEYKDAWYGGKAQSGQKEMDARYSSVLERFDNEILTGKVSVHRGYSTDVLEQFPDGFFDWVYMDGNHLYEFVKKGLNVSFLKVKPRGLIAGRLLTG